MDIKWSYYLLAIIYVLVGILRIINTFSAATYKKNHLEYKSVFSIKKDFFTTMSIVCVVITLGINIAAMVGDRPLVMNSIIITILVIGCTVLNSFYTIYFSDKEESIYWLGYQLKAGEIESLKVKEGHFRTMLNMTFTKEIDSYNYAKVLVFGQNKKELQDILQKLTLNKNK